MGQIIIKVRGNLNETIDLTDFNRQEILKLEGLLKALKCRQSLEKLLSHSGALPPDFSVSEDELHGQEP